MIDKFQQFQLIFVVLTSIAIGIGKCEDICRLFPNGTKIRDPFLCTQYIECIDFKSNRQYCPSNTPYYDITVNKCASKLANTTTCHLDACNDAVNEFIGDPNSCTRYYYCMDENTPLGAECPNQLHFNETRQACIYTEASNCKPANLKIDYCSFVPKNVNFADESSYTKYQYCNLNGVLVNKTCTGADEYLRDVGSCGSSICGTHKKPKTGFVDHPNSCASYYYCRSMSNGGFDENPIAYKCPTDTLFSADKQACVNPLEVHCTSNRCDGRTKQFVVSSNFGCRDYHLCSNGAVVMNGTCGNAFFNEENGVCHSKIEQYPACIVSS